MRVFLSSEHDISPRLQKVMSHAKERVCPETTIQFSMDTSAISDRATVLAMGTYKRKGGERVVQLPSAKALMSRADSITRLTTAFRLLVNPPELEPMRYEVCHYADL